MPAPMPEQADLALRDAAGIVPILPDIPPTPPAADDDVVDGERRGRPVLWASLIAGALGLGTVLFLGRINAGRYAITCSPDEITAEQGRGFPPWGTRAMTGTEWKVIAIPPNAECKPRDTDNVDELAGWYLDALVDRANAELVSHDPARVEIAAAELDQALLLARAPERRDQRNDIARLQGDIEYWRASAKLAAAQSAMLDAAKQFDAAAAKRPRHVADATASTSSTPGLAPRSLPASSRHRPRRPDRPARTTRSRRRASRCRSSRPRSKPHNRRSRSSMQGCRAVASCCSRRWAVAALALACRGGGRDATGAASGAPATPPAAIDAAPVQATRSDAAMAGSGSDDPPATAAAYRAALKRGRVATDAKRYADAIAAFDDALAARPNDARAQSERGYARLLDGTDLAAAEADLDAAAARTKDAKLLSSIWFNRGLVEERRKEPDNAIVDFYLADQLRSSPATRAKLDGKTVCPARVDRPTITAGSNGTIDAADWLALLHAMPFAVIDDDAPPKTAAAARDALGASAKLPTIAVAGEAGRGRDAYLVFAHATGLRAVLLGEDAGGRCPGSVDFHIAAGSGAIALVHGSWTVEGGMTDMCRTGSDELVECSGKDGEIQTSEACLGGRATISDVAIDTRTGAVIIVSRPEPTVDTPATRVDVALTGSGVVLTGVTCDRTVAWAAGASSP
jgi:tetratricopeptide (TPR) repeat protein